MRPHLRYVSYVARHKWFVFHAGLKTAAPIWRLIIHDWSKLTRAEWTPYVRLFYGQPPNVSVLRHHFGGRPNDAANLADWKAVRQAAFDKAWLHHQHHNPHHWQHWCLREDDGDLKALEMPTPLVREMVADWMGAGRAITGQWGIGEWYAEAAPKMKLHPSTQELVESLVLKHAGDFRRTSRRAA